MTLTLFILGLVRLIGPLAIEYANFLGIDNRHLEFRGKNRGNKKKTYKI